MRIIRLSNLLLVGTLTVCGCNQDVRKPINPDAIESSELSDIRLPERAPNFSLFDFGLAEIDEENADNVLYGRSLFAPREVTKQQSYQETRMVKIEREITDAAGKKQMLVEEMQVPENRTCDVTMTVYQVVDDQVLCCPIQSLTAFDRLGKQLSVEEIRSALSNGCRAVLRSTDSPDEPFYGGFFDSNTLFIHSNDWIEGAYGVATRPDKPVETETLIPNLPTID